MKALLACSLVAATLMSGCLSGPAQDRTPRTQDPSRLSHTRVYCTPDNESHFGTETLELPKVDAAPPAPHFFARGNSAARMAIAGFDAGWGTHDMQARSFHPAPSPQYVVYLEGVMTIMTSDGDSRMFRPGDVIRVEDTAPCKGHISVVGDRPAYTMIVR